MDEGKDVAYVLARIGGPYLEVRHIIAMMLMNGIGMSAIDGFSVLDVTKDWLVENGYDGLYFEIVYQP